MRNTIVLACMLTLAESAMGQSLEIETLKQAISKHPQQDTTRVNSLNELASIADVPTNEKERLAREALNISRSLQYSRGQGYALLNLGVVNTVMGKNTEAALLLNQADSIAKQTGDAALTVRILLSASANTYDNKVALDCGLKAEALAKKIGDKALLSACERRISSIYHASLSDYPRAMEYALKSLGSAEESNSLNAQALTWSGLGGLYSQIGDQENALLCFKKAAAANKQLQNKQIGRTLLLNIGESYRLMGNYPQAIKSYQDGLEGETRIQSIAIGESNLADVYTRMDSLDLAFQYGFSSLASSKKINDQETITWIDGILSRAYLKKHMPDSALYYAARGLAIAKETGTIEYMRDNAFALANAYAFKRKFDSAYHYHIIYTNYRDSMFNAEVSNKSNLLKYNFDVAKTKAQIAELNQQKKAQQNFLISALVVLGLIVLTVILLLRTNRQKQKANSMLEKQKQEIDDKATELSIQKDNLQQSYNNVELLGEIGRKITASLSVEAIIGTAYDNVNALMDASVFGIGIYHEERKSIDFPATYERGRALAVYSNSIYDENRLAAICFNSRKEIAIGNLQAEFQRYLQHVPDPARGDQALSLIYLPLTVNEKMLGVITVQSFKENAFSDYHLYMLRNIAIYAAIAIENAESFNKLTITVDSLKQTQRQLIQSEKMASLGELTAGIAHEIQNPLNFVNNFSEVNYELIEELQGERLKVNGERNENLENEILVDLKKNLEKINHHGKRADAIVKGMLQHSRSSNGVKEPTDINAVCDEYLRLAYHGLRAKNKSFNAEMQTDFDETIGKVHIIPQDIGRVLLNLINNAFYAVDEKKRQLGDDYEPTVSLSTRKNNDNIEISIADNGNGIPQKIVDKIFQPFFTTKPTGQGTGLGLSLAYDIVKAHGGEIKVETKEGEGSEFIIQLPAA